MGTLLWARRKQGGRKHTTATMAANDEGNPELLTTNRLFVGNLAYRVSWHDLKDHFKTAGEVKYADVLRSSSDSRSKGCGIVEMATLEDAKRAMEELHGSDLHGRSIFIRGDR